MQLFAEILILVGSALLLVSAIGILKFRTVQARIHASSIASSLGAVVFSLVYIISDFSMYRLIFGVVIVSVLYLTAPLGAQLLIRKKPGKN